MSRMPDRRLSRLPNRRTVFQRGRQGAVRLFDYVYAPRRARGSASTWRSCHGAIAFLACAAVLVLTTSARAAFEPKDATWQGTSELVAIAREKLGKSRVHIVPSISWEELQPMDALLVLHPEHELDYREVAAFLAAGGRLALLDDYGKADSLLRRFRIHRVRAPLDPRDPLRDNPSLPIAVPAAGPDGRPHPVVGGVDRVVTNHPTGLETDRGLRLTTVLEMQSSSEPPTPLALIGVIGDAKRCGLISDSLDETPNGAAPSNGAPVGRCGRLLSMGDPS